jgi:hypothetical protein
MHTKAMKIGVLVLLGLIAVSSTSAQVPAAPLPAQIFSAKTVFISNTSGRSAVYPGISELTYNEFYAAMKAWGRYQLVTAPGDADLVFEIRYATALGPTNGGNSGQYAEFELTIFDTKTHVVLWAISETVVPIKHKSDQESLEQTLANVVADAKKLVAQAPGS